MKNLTKSGKALTKDQMKNVFGGIGPIGEKCGTQVCSRYQACCSRDTPTGTVLYCTTTACL